MQILHRIDIEPEKLEEGIFLSVVNLKVNIEFGRVDFLRGIEAPEVGLTDKEVFVLFNGDTVDIIQWGDDYIAYVQSEQFRQMVRDTWVDRIVDR